MPESDVSTPEKELEEIAQKLSDPAYLSNPTSYAALSKRYGELKRILARGLDSKSDEIIMELRAGAGGDEAALFAQELYRMYTSYAQRLGFKTKVLDSHRTEIGVLKEIIFEISGKNAYANLAREGGVHRVKRIPETEKSGRIHTSTVSVAVLPKAQPADIEIKTEDIRIDTYRSSGPGGQNVNKTSSAVRITHIPTGIVVASQEERYQPQNKELAMTILRSKLLQKQKEDTSRTTGALRHEQIGTAERSEKIRTYNFPQDRITDHRVKKSWSKIERIMNGEIDEIIKALVL
jgi:peptide chain release factor 1